MCNKTAADNFFCIGDNFSFAIFNSIGELIRFLLVPAFAIAGIIVLFFLLFAAFKFMTSGGDKQAVQDARNMITHGIIGLFALILLFLVMRFIPEFFGLNITIIQDSGLRAPFNTPARQAPGFNNPALPGDQDGTPGFNNPQLPNRN